MRTFGKLAIVALIVLTATLVIVSCGKSGSLNPNQAPTVQITSYNGDSLAAGENPNGIAPSDTVLYQQKIYWYGTDADGWVTGYAYRVYHIDANDVITYLATPGNDAIDNDGWVYHYKAGADETIPLIGDENSDNVRTIWTTSPYTVINFPAADTLGNSENLTTVFELKCIDNRDTESEIVRRFFVAESVAPVATITTTKGDPEGRTVGTGIRFEFGMIDEDPYVVTKPWYYQYRVCKTDMDGNDLSDPEWTDLTDFETRARVLLTKETSPGLSSDFDENGNQITMTRIYARVFDEAGIVSEPVSKTFNIKEGYYPQTLLYKYNIYALGSNHFVTYQDASLNIVIPSQQTSEGTVFSTPPFIDKDGRYVALWSNDIRIFMSWGFHGEFTEDNPRNKRNDDVLDAQTGINYLSEIQYFDLRIQYNSATNDQGEPFYYPPYAGHPEYYVTDNDGTEWLRVPLNSDIAQEAVLNNLPPTDPDNPDDYHIFIVRAVDLQNVAGEPAEFQFKLDEPVPPEEKHGILIIDDEQAHAFSPEPKLTDFYNFVLGSYDRVDILNRKELEDTVWDSKLHYGWDVLSPTDLQTYKLVIWHSENPSASNSHYFYKEYDVMNLYLRGGGNIIVTGGANLADTFNGCKNNAFPLLSDYFGISTSSVNPTPSYSFIPGSIRTNPWFTHATAQEPGYEDLDINLKWVQAANGDYLLLEKGGMDSVGFFDPEYFASYGITRLYRLGLKDPDSGENTPTQAEYDMYNDKICAFSYQREVPLYPAQTQINSLFGFPPTYMDSLQVKNSFETLVDQVLNQ